MGVMIRVKVDDSIYLGHTRVICLAHLGPAPPALIFAVLAHLTGALMIQAHEHGLINDAEYSPEAV